MGHDPHHDHHHDDPNLDRGLAFDVATLMQRRRALKLFAGAGLLAVVGCGSNTATDTAATTTTGRAAGSTAPGATTATTNASSATTATTAAAGSAAGLAEIPQETAGPYPGDGSNGPNVLDQSGVVRRDIRSSFGTSTTTAGGVPLTVELTIIDTATRAAVAGASVYLWQCDREGRYSLYSQGVTDENYLRGVQEADGNGLVTFQTVFPGAYPGRWPHIHFEVYPSLAEATKAGTPMSTSQLALPEETCQLVYATDGYSQSVRALAQTSLATDMVFRDGWELEMPAVTGDVGSGFTARLNVGV